MTRILAVRGAMLAGLTGRPLAVAGGALLAGLLAVVPASAASASPGWAAPARYVPGPCPRALKTEIKTARCGFLVVPEDHADPKGPKIRLTVAVVPATSRNHDGDPVVVLDGGPGNDAILDAPLYHSYLSKGGLTRHHDLIFMSQRGTRSASPALTCPSVDQFLARSVGLVLDARSTARLLSRDTAECRRHLTARNVDLRVFNTSQSAADLAALREALGIWQWDVFAHSYGTDLALTYMREYPQGIRSVTLDGTVPPSVASPGWAWSSVKEAFDNILQACAAQRACRARYPHTGATFSRLVNRLERHPIRTRVKLADGRTVKVVLDGGALVNWLILASHDAKNLPLEVDQLAHANPEPIARQWAASRDTPETEGVIAHGLTFSVQCSEWLPYESPAAQFRAAKRAFPTFPRSVLAQPPQFTFIRQACRAWNVPAAPPAVRQVTRSAIPTLLVAGSFDAQTGAQWSRYAARTLSRSRVVVFRGVAHGVFTNRCGASVIASFFSNPRKPNTGCVASVRPAPFTIGPRAR